MVPTYLEAEQAAAALAMAIGAVSKPDDRSGNGSAEPSALTGDYVVEIIAWTGGEPILLCEAAPGIRLPGYFERRGMRNRLTAVGRHVLFTDSARSSFIWTTRRSRAGTPSRYLEFTLPQRLEAFLRYEGEETGRCDMKWIPGDSRVSATVLRCFRERLSSGRRPPEPEAAGIQDWIENVDDVTTLRLLLRTVREMRVFDPDAAEASWLLQVATTLETVFVAVLERSRAWLDDAGRIGGARRPEHLRDIRSVVVAADDDRLHPSPTAFARRHIVQRTLHGVAPSPAAARRCRRELLEYAGIAPTASSYFATNLRTVNRRKSGCPTPSVDRAGDATADSRGTFEDLEVLRTAWRELRDARLRGDGYAREWAGAARRFEAGVRRVERSHRFRKPGSGGSEARTAAETQPHGFVGALWGEAFDLVRERL